MCTPRVYPLDLFLEQDFANSFLYHFIFELHHEKTCPLRSLTSIYIVQPLHLFSMIGAIIVALIESLGAIDIHVDNTGS